MKAVRTKSFLPLKKTPLRSASTVSVPISLGDVPGKRREWTPLIGAIHQNRLDTCISFLVHFRRDKCLQQEIDCRNNAGRTPLMIASYHGYYNIVKLLIENGADIDAQDDTGWTAMMLASSQAHCDVVELLQCHGANCSLRNNEKKTATDIAKCFQRCNSNK